MGETSGSAEFDVYGLLLSGVYGTHDISLGDESTGSFVIMNPGLLSQSGLKIEQLREPVGCELTVRNVSSIVAGGQVEVSYTLKANAVTDGGDWLQVPLHITTTEGCSADYTIYYYVRSLKGQLTADQTRIETTITKGVPREYQIQVSNVGRGETGTISLSLPSWVRSLTPMQMPSLASGESATIVLQLTTTEDMQLNVPVNGQIGINCEKSDGVPISLYMTPVSEDKGHLLIDVVDEYTYYAEGSPHVEGARVLVKHPTTGQVIAQGLSGADGRYLVELPEGWYTVSVNADKHQSYQTNLEIAPGKQTGKEIFLTYEAVSYSWEVVETEIEDEYIIETVVKYETNVPKPVIIITLPDEKPEIGGIIPKVMEPYGKEAIKNSVKMDFMKLFTNKVRNTTSFAPVTGIEIPEMVSAGTKAITKRLSRFFIVLSSICCAALCVIFFIIILMLKDPKEKDDDLEERRWLFEFDRRNKNTGKKISEEINQYN